MFDDFDCYICPEEMNEEQWNDWCKLQEEENIFEEYVAISIVLGG